MQPSGSTNYLKDFILLTPEKPCINLAMHSEFHEDGILNVETCRSMLFVIIVFDIIVQYLVKIVNKKNCK
jgi:hypothetical protein